MLSSSGQPFPVTSSDNSTRHCFSCLTTSSSRWRTGPDGFSTLCSKCGNQHTKMRLTLYQHSHSGQISATRHPHMIPVSVIGFHSRIQTQYQYSPQHSLTQSRVPRDLTRPIVIPKHRSQLRHIIIQNQLRPVLSQHVAMEGQLNPSPTVHNTAGVNPLFQPQARTQLVQMQHNFAQLTPSQPVATPSQGPPMVQTPVMACPTGLIHLGRGEAAPSRPGPEDVPQHIVPRYGPAASPLIGSSNVVNGSLALCQPGNGRVEGSGTRSPHVSQPLNLPGVQGMVHMVPARFEIGKFKEKCDDMQRHAMQGRSVEKELAKPPLSAAANAESSVAAFRAENQLRSCAGNGNIGQNGDYCSNAVVRPVHKHEVQAMVLKSALDTHQNADSLCPTGEYLINQKRTRGFGTLLAQPNGGQRELQQMDNNAPQTRGLSLEREASEEFQSQSPRRNMASQLTVSNPTESYRSSVATCQPAVGVLSGERPKDFNAAALHTGYHPEARRTARFNASCRTTKQERGYGHEGLRLDERIQKDMLIDENGLNKSTATICQGFEKRRGTTPQLKNNLGHQDRGQSVEPDHTPMLIGNTKQAGLAPDRMITSRENEVQRPNQARPETVNFRVPLITSRKKILELVSNHAPHEIMRAFSPVPSGCASEQVAGRPTERSPRATARESPRQRIVGRHDSMRSSPIAPQPLVEVADTDSQHNHSEAEPSTPQSERRTFSRFRRQRRKQMKNQKMKPLDDDYVPDNIELGEEEWSEGSAEAEDPPTPLAMIADENFESDEDDREYRKANDQREIMRRNEYAAKLSENRSDDLPEIIVVDDDSIDSMCERENETNTMTDEETTPNTACAEDKEAAKAVTCHEIESVILSQADSMLERGFEDNSRTKNSGASRARRDQDPDHLQNAHRSTLSMIRSEEIAPLTVRYDMSALRNPQAIAPQNSRLAQSCPAGGDVSLKNGTSRDYGGYTKLTFENRVRVPDERTAPPLEAVTQGVLDADLLQPYDKPAEKLTRRLSEIASGCSQECRFDEFPPRDMRLGECSKVELNRGTVALPHGHRPSNTITGGIMPQEAESYLGRMKSDINLRCNRNIEAKDGDSVLDVKASGEFISQKSGPPPVKVEGRTRPDSKAMEESPYDGKHGGSSAIEVNDKFAVPSTDPERVKEMVGASQAMVNSRDLLEDRKMANVATNVGEGSTTNRNLYPKDEDKKAGSNQLPRECSPFGDCNTANLCSAMSVEPEPVVVTFVSENAKGIDRPESDMPTPNNHLPCPYERICTEGNGKRKLEAIDCQAAGTSEGETQVPTKRIRVDEIPQCASAVIHHFKSPLGTSTLKREAQDVPMDGEQRFYP